MPMTRELLNRALTELQPLIEGASIPLLRMPEGGARAHATGTLVKVGAARFVVTAAHALVEDWKNTEPSDDFNIGTGAVHHNGRIFQLGGKVRWDPELDVGVLKLSDESVNAVLEAGLHFLGPASFDTGVPPIAGSDYLVHGWPLENATRTVKGLQMKPFIYRTIPYTGSTESFAAFDRTQQFALSFDRERYVGPDGELARPPDGLDGISGCGVWRLMCPGEEPDGWRVSDVRCIGVQHTVVRARPTEHVIVGTHWHRPMEVVRFAFPDLAGCFRGASPASPAS